LTEAFGARIESWPTAEQNDGEAFARLSPNAAAAMDAARVVDDALDLAAPAVDDAAVERLLARLSARIDEIERVPAVPVGLWTRFRPHLPTAGFLTAMWLVGVVVGNVGWTGSEGVAASLDGILSAGYHQSLYLAALSE